MLKKRSYSLKWRIVTVLVTTIVLILIILRLYLGMWLLQYVNNVLAHIQGFRGSIESLDIDLYRGAYRINKLELKKVEGNIPTPFLAIGSLDLSIQWSALIHGRVVSKITLTHPVINFAVSKSATQTGENVDWTKPIKDLMPIDIDSVRIEDGSVTYQDFSSTPKVDIFIHHMDGEVLNLRNVTHDSEALPSSVDIHGTSIGKGNLKINGKMNILKQTPDMNLYLALENVNLPALNNYSEAYGAFDFKTGNFNLYSQFNAKNKKIRGYIKPIITDLSIDVLKNANPLEIAWSSIVAVVVQVFTNLSHDQFATKIDLDGSLDEVNTDTWSAIIGIFHNAFIAAINKGFDQTGNGTPDPAVK